MEDELELIDPDHPDAYEAATAAARLLIHVHEQRHRPLQEENKSDDLMNGNTQCPDTSTPKPT